LLLTSRFSVARALSAKTLGGSPHGAWAAADVALEFEASGGALGLSQ
jgi:hypothetical protein